MNIPQEVYDICSQYGVWNPIKIDGKLVKVNCIVEMLFNKYATDHQVDISHSIEVLSDLNSAVLNPLKYNGYSEEDMKWFIVAILANKDRFSSHRHFGL